MRRPAITFDLGDMLAILPTLDAESFDACITDPPYHLTAGKRGGSGVASVNLDTPAGRARIGTAAAGGFMGQQWDGGDVAFRVETWAEVLRILKPGGYLAAFAAPRNYHRLAVAIEDAGFEIRDQIDWLFGQGFPKSVDGEREVARALCELAGRHFLRKLPKREADRKPDDHVCPATETSMRFLGTGSALKPAHEPIVLARRPFRHSIGANLLAHGTGGLQIDAARIAMSDQDAAAIRDMGGYGREAYDRRPGVALELSVDPMPSRDAEPHDDGRWPPNVVLTHAPDCRQALGLCSGDCVVQALDEQTGELQSGGRTGLRQADKFRSVYGAFQGDAVEKPITANSGGASRFFPVFDWTAEDLDAIERTPALPCFRYDGKADRTERDLGCEGLALRSPAEATESPDESNRLDSPRTGAGRTSGARNYHPTVKPLGLMRWLVRLLCKPGDRVLEPFAGSGTTPMACRVEGVGCHAIEREPDYLEIAKRRTAAVSRPAILELIEASDLAPSPVHSQAGLFDEIEGRDDAESEPAEPVESVPSDAPDLGLPEPDRTRNDPD